jgi:hypothetical protein
MSNTGTTTGIQNEMVKNTMQMINSLSTYSPLILTISIIFFSFLTGSMEKAFVYFLWISLITFFRIILFSYRPLKDPPGYPNPCVPQMFMPKDVTYSSYILSFTFIYFLMPMILVSRDYNINLVNYGMVAFFIAYIGIDIFIKKQNSCFQHNSLMAPVSDIVAGALLGMLIAGPLMYNDVLKPYLYINEVNSNKEVCSMPAKQQFRCNVYKNGELVGSSVE